jgi:hypothetical protein
MMQKLKGIFAFCPIWGIGAGKGISIQYDNLTLKKETHSFYADLSSDHFHKEHLGS